jgi:FkbM family methyltransferase
MKYDFIEIGTSNFDTLIQEADANSVGISIEPIKNYLNQLPNKPNVKKLNVAVSLNDLEEQVKVYYIPERIVVERNLPLWLLGCNTVGSYHLQHHLLGVLDLVECETVASVPVGKVFEEHDVEDLGFLKIDTEGNDTKILHHLASYLEKSGENRYPRKIRFESNELTPKNQVFEVIGRYACLGYRLVHSGYDTILER